MKRDSKGSLLLHKEVTYMGHLSHNQICHVLLYFMQVSIFWLKTIFFRSLQLWY